MGPKIGIKEKQTRFNREEMGIKSRSEIPAAVTERIALKVLHVQYNCTKKER